jgi:hypothetical protein
MKTLFALLTAALLAFAAPASAQITVPYPNFQTGDDILPSEMNANFAQIAADAFNRNLGGTISGALTSSGASLVGTWAGAPTFSGVPIFSAGVTISGDLAFTTTSRAVRMSTSDGTDNASLELDGGGASGLSRGGELIVYGNEHAQTGNVVVAPGTATGSKFRVIVNNGATEALGIDGTTGVMTASADFAFSTNSVIRRSTADASDNGFLVVNGGGGSTETRGGFITLSGNERATVGGYVEAQIGNVGSAQFVVRRSDTTQALNVLGADGFTTFTSSASNPAWLFNSTHANGAFARITKSGTSVLSIGAATAAGVGSGADALIAADGGDLRILVGSSTNTINLAQGHLTFPATQNASTDANTLDDYEEGTWSPTDASGASLSFTLIASQYVKIGQLVVATTSVTYPSTANGSNASIGGLPFTSQSTGSNLYGCFLKQSTEATATAMNVAAGGTSINITTLAGTAVTNATMSTDTIVFTCIYRASA